MPVDREHDIADGKVGGARRMHPFHQDSRGAFETEPPGEVRGHGLNFDTEPRPDHASGGHHPLHGDTDQIRGDREADPDRPAGARKDDRIDADQAPVQSHEGAARIAGIDRRVGLDEGSALRSGARLGGHDAARDRLAHPERVADGEHDVADRHRIGVAELEGGKRFVPRIDAQDREVGRFVAADERGLELAAVGQRHDDLVAVLHHVMVGDDDSVGGDDHAGPQ